MEPGAPTPALGRSTLLAGMESSRLMTKALQLAHLLLLLVASASVGAIGWAGYHALNQWGGAAPDKNKINALILHADSSITHADTAFKNLADATGDWSDASKQQARDVRALLSASGRTLDAIGEDAHAAKETLSALTGTAQELSSTTRTANETIGGLQPLTRQLAQNGAALERTTDAATARINDDRITRLVANLEAITGSGAGIMADSKTVADYAKDRITKPQTFRQKIMGKAGDLLDIGAFAARHF